MPAEPSMGSGAGKPAEAQRQCGRTGQRSHAGDRFRHTRAPRSKTAWPQVQPQPSGTASSATAWASAGRTGRPASARATKRPALVSTRPMSRSWAKTRTARAVYGPTPGRASRSARVVGSRPPKRSTHWVRGAVEEHGAPVVSEAGPFVDDVTDRGRRADGRRREPFEEGVPARRSTRATCVCWSMSSETSTAHGSRLRRQGRSRPLAAHQSINACCSGVTGAARSDRAEDPQVEVEQHLRRVLAVVTAQRHGLVTTLGRHQSHPQRARPPEQTSRPCPGPRTTRTTCRRRRPGRCGRRR